MKKLALGVAVVLIAGATVLAGGRDDDRVAKLVARPYYVGDLILTAKQKAEIAAAHAENKETIAPEDGADFEPLVELLTSTVAPDSWSKEDGKKGPVGTMTPFRLSNSLIIRNTSEVHEQIAKRLRQLRRLPVVRGADEKD